MRRDGLHCTEKKSEKVRITQVSVVPFYIQGGSIETYAAALILCSGDMEMVDRGVTGE